MRITFGSFCLLSFFHSAIWVSLTLAEKCECGAGNKQLRESWEASWKQENYYLPHIMSLSRRRENSCVAIEDNTEAEEEVEEEDLVYKHLTVTAVIDLFAN